MLTTSYSNYQIRELVPEALITLDEQDRFIYVNQFAGDMLERKAEELLGKHIWTEFPEAAGQPIHEAYIKAVQSKQHIYLEEYNSTHDRWFENHIYQSPGGVSICFSDITERKKTESVHQSNELKYKAFFENSMDGVILGYPDGTVYAANAAACRIFGRSETEICSLGRTGLLDTSDPRLKKLVEEREQKGEAEGESTAIKKDGTKFPVGFRTKLFTDLNGREHTIVIIRDNSELNTAKDKIIEQHSTLHSLIESISNSVFSLDRNYRYTSFNKAHAVGMKAIYGKEIQLGTCLFDYQTEGDAKVAKPNLDRALAGETFADESYSGDEFLKRSFFEIIHHPVKDSEGNIIGVSVEAKDITARKKTEDDLNESEALYRSILNATPDDITITDLQGRILMISPSSLPIWGYQHEDEILGKYLSEFVIPEDIGRIYENISLFRQGVNVNPGLYTGVRKDKSSFPLEVNADFIRKSDGEPVKIILSIRDITERKLAAQALIESESKYRELVENSPDSIVIYQEGKVVFVNNETVRLMAAESKAQLIGQSVLNFVHPDYRPFFSERMKKVAGEGETLPLAEEKFVCLEGTEIDVEVKVFPMVHDGKPSVQLIIRDITEQKHAEQILHESEEKWSKLVSFIPDFIALHDLDGHYLFLNHFAEGYSYKDFVGKKMYDFIADESKELFRKNFEQCIDTNQPRQFTFTAFGDNAVFRIYENYLVPIVDKEQKVISVMSIAKDITERKLAEKKMNESEHLLNESQRVSKIGSYKLEMDKGEWQCSHELENIFGIRESEVHTMEEWESVLHPDHREMMKEYFEKEVNDGHNRFNREYKIINKKTGETHWVHGVGDLTFDINGNTEQMIGTIQDISEKKKAEELLHAKEKLYRALIENSNDGVVILDAWGNFKYIAPSIKTVLGYDEEELLNTRLLNLTHPDDHSKVQEIYQEVLTKPGLHNPEFIPRLKHKNGEWRCIAGALNNLIKDPLISGVIVNFRDVTEQVHAEQTIRESEIKYRSLIDNAGDAIAIYTPAGNILDMNVTGQNMLGYTKEEVLQKNVTDFFTSEEMETIPFTYDKLKTGESSLKQRNFINKDRSMVLTEVRSQILPDGNLLSIIRDLTERMEIQKQLRISNDNYSSLVNTIEGIVWEADAKSTQFSFVSMQAEQILGYPAKQWVTEKDFWPNHLHKADREWAMNYCAKYTKEKKSHDFEYRMIAADGRIVWLHDIVTVIVENDEPVKLRGILIDITEKKLMEKGLEDYKFALNQSSIVDVSDSSGTIHYANENFCRISGYSLKELIGQDHRILKSGYHSKEHYKSLWDTVTAGKVWRAEVKNKAKDGSFYWVDSTIIPFLGDNGKPFQFITIRTDITKKKEAETQIMNALERYDILSKATSDTIWDWDVLNNSIIYNQGIVKNFGYRQTRIRNVKEWWDLNIHPDDRGKVNEAFEKAFQKKKAVVQVEYRYRSADGNYRHILDRAFIIYGAGKKPERMIGSMQDITSEKEIAIRIEKEVIDAQEREWNQIGMELHDNVNQILAASMLLMGLGKEKMERGQNAASIINESEKHVGEAIAEIRRLSHQLAPVSVANLSLAQVFESLFETVNVGKKVKIKLQMKGMKEFSIPHKLQINLYRILQEQLNNILKHAKATEVTVSFRKVKHSFVFKIADNGLGFDPEAHTNGIGLENIKRRAKVFSGEFKLKTAPGKGCAIIVEIPENSFA